MTEVDWKALAAQAQPTTNRVRLCLRGDLVSRQEAGEIGLEEEIEAATVDFVLRGLNRQTYRNLEAKYPDPDGDGGWDLDTFPEALVRECLAEPVVAADDPLFDILTPGQVEALFEAAFKACNEVTQVPLHKRG
mgnify:CR=1 FL=1